MGDPYRADEDDAMFYWLNLPGLSLQAIYSSTGWTFRNGFAGTLRRLWRDTDMRGVWFIVWRFAIVVVVNPDA